MYAIELTEDEVIALQAVLGDYAVCDDVRFVFSSIESTRKKIMDVIPSEEK